MLGVFDLFAIGYGDLGSSIYYALGITALYALGATPIALTLAGVVFAFHSADLCGNELHCSRVGGVCKLCQARVQRSDFVYRRLGVALSTL